MNVLKNPSFFRPSSRPSSPAPPILGPIRPESSQGSDRQPRPSTKLSLTSFIRQAPSPSPSAVASPAPLVQDGSYLEMLSLKLSEAVSKALVQPTGPLAVGEQTSIKRPIPQGRGLALGSSIASELNAVHDNPHLHKAVLRSLQRPFTVLLTNISGQLSPTLSSPSFQTVPTASNPCAFPNSVQLYAISIARFCEELLQVFQALGLGTDADVRGDGLKSIRDGIISVINRVVNPFVASIRAELIPLIESLENSNTLPPSAKATPGVKSAVVYHPSVVALQTLMPAYSRALAMCTTSTPSQSTLASFLILILWKAMVALSHRVDIKTSPVVTPEGTPLLSAKKRRGSPPATTPPLTPPPGRFMIKLPPSRPPSPPTVISNASAATDCKALYDLLVNLPRPSCSGQGSTLLAREAVDEAFEGLRTLPALLDVVSKGVELHSGTDKTAENLIRLTTDIPSLTALSVILRAFGGPGQSSVAALLGIGEDEYRKGCLSGFSRAEECAAAVVQRVKDALQKDAQNNPIVIRWLELELADIENE